jgi:hypothetical protein
MMNSRPTSFEDSSKTFSCDLMDLTFLNPLSILTLLLFAQMYKIDRFHLEDPQYRGQVNY